MMMQPRRRQAEEEVVHVSAALTEDPLDLLARFERSVATLTLRHPTPHTQLQWHAREPQVWCLAEEMRAHAEAAHADHMSVVETLHRLETSLGVLIKRAQTEDDSS